MVRLQQGRKNRGEHCHWLEQEHPFIFLVFKCHPTHSTKLAFLPRELSEPIKRLFPWPCLSSSKDSLPFDADTHHRADAWQLWLWPWGASTPHIWGPPAVTRLRHSEPLQIRDNQPCQREGWASCLTHRHDQLLSANWVDRAPRGVVLSPGLRDVRISPKQMPGFCCF